MKKMVPIFLLFSLLLVPSIQGADFCVAELTGVETPAGYSCKNPAKVTVDDFVFTKLRAALLNTSNSMKAAATPVFVQQFPALNGQGLAMAKAEFAPGGVIPIHTHPHAAEMIYVLSGSLTGVLISTANVAYFKTLEKGDVMIFPKGLLHFQVNTGKVAASILVIFSNHDPGVQNIPLSLFSNNLPSELVEKATFIDDAEVKKLKKLLGGTG